MFGITENGDPSVNYEWVDKLSNFEGNILITKNLSEKFIETLLGINNENIILHVSCTGYGGTILEPNLPTYQDTIQKIKGLVNRGFPVEKIVLRVDPIIPTNKGLKVCEQVICSALEEINGLQRVRISIMDMYPHVAKRFENSGLPHPYNGKFQAPAQMLKKANEKIKELQCKYQYVSFESCAEVFLSAPKAIGCVSYLDYQILHLGEAPKERKGQRTNCLCCSSKKDLLTHKYNQTGYNHCYGCLYCYWKTEKDM